MDVTTKRAYASAVTADGRRILIDRLWPRGLRKDAACIHYWARDIAPSTELRKWFAHDPERWNEFRRRYHSELKANRRGLAALRQALEDASRITLVFAARDEQHNNAVALAEYLREHF